MFTIISLNSSARSKLTTHAGKIAVASGITALVAGLFIYNLMGGPGSFLPKAPSTGYIVSGVTLLFLLDSARYAILYYKKTKSVFSSSKVSAIKNSSGKHRASSTATSSSHTISFESTAARENRLSDPIALSLRKAVLSDESSSSSKSTLVHFHTIFSRSSSKIVLGNDRTRELLSQAGRTSKDLAPIKREYDRYEVFGDAGLTSQIDAELRTLSEIDLMVSFNGRVTKDGNGEQQISSHAQISLPGFTHLQHPISEIDKHYAPALARDKLEPIFLAMDAALNNNQTVFLHCNQGEHRSATILILYIASRTQCSFEQAHKFVSSKREIKPFNSSRITLMTTAYRLRKEMGIH